VREGTYDTRTRCTRTYVRTDDVDKVRQNSIMVNDDGDDGRRFAATISGCRRCECIQHVAAPHINETTIYATIQADARSTNY